METVAAARSSTIEVEALLQSTHLDTQGKNRTHLAPLAGYSVVLTGVDGVHRDGVIDSRGHAVVTVLPGQYVVSTSERDACYPVKVTLRAGDFRALSLKCAAP